MKAKNKTRVAGNTTSKPSPKMTATTSMGGGATSRFRMQTILVPVDLSEPSRKALRYALALARQFGGKLILLFAVEPVATPDFAYHPLMMDMDEVTAAAEERLKKLCAEEEIDPSWIEKTLVRNGVAHTEITETAKSLKADLIVISTHGHTGLKHVLLGSTAERVVRHAGCPVLVVRAHA